MLYRIVGLGIFALFIFLNLFIPGTREAMQPSVEIYVQSSDTKNPLIEAEVISLAQEGVLQARTEISESFQVVRKYPVAVSLLFLLTQQNVAAVPNQSGALCLEFSPPKDLLASYQVLRI